jgi:uncharacterized beta-barrel protein YwiB (DUF1934 family)
MRETEPVQVGIKLESRQDGEETVTEYTGTMFRKPNAVYLRYEETDEDGSGSSVTVRFGGGELKITRRGEVDSEQSFSLGMRKSGSYQSQIMRLSLETETDHLQITEGESGGLPVTLEWRYELWINEEWTGRFDLRLHIQEDTKE